MSVLGFATVFRGAAKMYFAVCLQNRLGGHRTLANLYSRCQHIGSFRRPSAIPWTTDPVCFRYDRSTCVLTHRNRSNVSLDYSRYFSARPLRDVKMDNGQRDDIPNGVTRIPTEICLVSGKSATICSCSCCTKKRLHRDTVNAATVNKTKSETSDLANEMHTTSPSSEVPVDGSLKTSSEDVADATPVKQPGLLKRFHMMYKQYGLVMFCVHWSLASVWTGMFYYAAISGVDVVPVLKWIGASDAVIAPFLRPTIGHAAVTYLLYKLATPVRYTLTIAGTQLTVKYLRQWGYMKAPERDDSLRSLVKDGRTKVKDKMDEVRDKVEDKFDEVRDKIETVRDKVEDKLDDIRDDVQELKGKIDGFRNQKTDDKNVGGIQSSKQQKM